MDLSGESTRSGYSYSRTTFGMNERMSYNISISASNETTTLNPAAILRFTIKVFLRNEPRIPIHYRSSTPIPSQTFFQEGLCFLRTLLSSLSSHRLFSAEAIEDIVESVAFEVRDIFQVDDAGPSSSEYQPPEIPVCVVINVADNSMLAARQDPAALTLRMVPATTEAIETSVKKSTVVESGCYCSVCLEEVVVNGECYTLPCNHFFHKKCIVRWLYTSHTCPLCRYPLPVSKE
ncbi:hypothetical protein PHAVU_002G114900 [Phaseolus vulgaris]|uniref:RING-type E3 ubiquitin transferase n=1 Tax=Phaseolus vulgaris TaxID=3885 RepID=V7CL18_PHAVU|nr:hypothetical protein PHAVU_002G114900g [Phaseolus vulgaris]ESW29980.1 hypothetical protein PHAVU_002G114900g [Phaseolus vulgaris]